MLAVPEYAMVLLSSVKGRAVDSLGILNKKEKKKQEKNLL